jgi:hypothetical protein
MRLRPIERGDFDKNVRGSGKLAVNKFEVAEGRKKRCTAARLFEPSLARRKTQRGTEARQALIRLRASGGTKEGDALDHSLILSCAGGEIETVNAG